jgi:DNA-binding SARP family transcriptional activator
MEMAGGSTPLALGELVRDRRRVLGWTQRELADAASIGLGTVRDLEQGVSRRPRVAARQRLATVLGLAPAQLGVMPAVRPALEQAGAEGRLRFQLFGSLRVWRGGAELVIRGERRKAILGLLLLQPGAVVSQRVIADVLWDGRLPSTAPGMIQTYVSQLRAALQPKQAACTGTSLIEMSGAGYRLRATGVEADIVDSQRLLAHARSVLAAGDPSRACVLFGQWLAISQGPLLADVELLGGHPALARMRSEYTRAVADYGEAASACGWHDRVLPHLGVAAEREPLNERVHACLMIALAGCGQQAAALQVYDTMRQRLDDELGVLPGAAIAAAHTRVLRREIAAAGPSQAGQRVTARASVSPGAVPCQLPPAVTDFTGRAGELARLRAWLMPQADQVGVPVAVISGPPGIGKTALLLQAGHLLRGSFPDGQLWAGLGPAPGIRREPHVVLGEWLRALGVPGTDIPEGTAERAARYRSILAGRRILVAVDAAETAADIRPLLPGTAGCAVVATSRSQRAAVPGARMLPLGLFTRDEATRLLGKIAGEGRSAAERDAAGALAESAGRLPLAVRIAGAQLAANPHLLLAAQAKDLRHQEREYGGVRSHRGVSHGHHVE